MNIMLQIPTDDNNVKKGVDAGLNYRLGLTENKLNITNTDKVLRKASSTSSMFIKTTISKPCIDTMISAVATILHS